MASHNSHENRRDDAGRKSPQAGKADTRREPRADDPRDGVPSVGRGLDEETGGDTISGFEPGT